MKSFTVTIRFNQKGIEFINQYWDKSFLDENLKGDTVQLHYSWKNKNTTRKSIEAYVKNSMESGLRGTYQIVSVEEI